MAILVTVPVPEDNALPRDEAEARHHRSDAPGGRRRDSGKDVTPFVLGKVLELTGGRSQAANIAALVNNARVGARIAQALSVRPTDYIR